MSYSDSTPAQFSYERAPRPHLKSLLVLASLLLISFAVAAFGAVTTIGAVDGWYATAEKVAWNPPNWIFGPVWTALYIAMAVAAWLIWRQRLNEYVGPALTLYVGQLFLNSVWTPVFFGGYGIVGSAELWIALAVILVLDVCVVATIISFWPISRPAGILLLPYLAWILYATTLNAGLAILNG